MGKPGLKKKISLGVFGAFVLIVVGVLIAAALQPAAFRIERRVEIASDASVVYAALEDFHRFGEWSPWEKLDPNMKRTFQGPPKGVGAIYSWVGNDDVGEGRMTITDAVPNQKVVVKLEFLKPFATTNTTQWLVQSKGATTTVSWVMEGRNDGFMPKVFALFMDMDKLVGKDFENGLANLKRVSEQTKAP